MPLQPVIKDAERRILELARRHCAKPAVFSFGAVEIKPVHFAVWVTTPTDRERDRLKTTPGLEDSFRAALLAAGYPAQAVPQVGFAYESQETVDRVHGGNWWYAVK